jgi:hypothetical protein
MAFFLLIWSVRLGICGTLPPWCGDLLCPKYIAFKVLKWSIDVVHYSFSNITIK